MEENNGAVETPEQSRRRKISETKKARFANEPHPLKGRAKTEEHKRAIGAANLGKRRTPEEIARMREARMAVGFSEESRRAAAERIRNNPYRSLPKSDSHRRALSEAKTGTTPLLRKYGIEPEEYERQVQAGNKWCSQGKHFAPASQFQRRRQFCENCKSEHHRAVLLRTKYGVTAEWYDHKLAEQGGGCAMCGQNRPSKGWNFMAIDHNHATGEVRGILCAACNAAVGVIENQEFLQRAARYLAQYGTLLRVEETPIPKE